MQSSLNHKSVPEPAVHISFFSPQIFSVWVYRTLRRKMLLADVQLCNKVSPPGGLEGLHWERGCSNDKKKEKLCSGISFVASAHKMNLHGVGCSTVVFFIIKVDFLIYRKYFKTGRLVIIFYKKYANFLYC